MTSPVTSTEEHVGPWTVHRHESNGTAWTRVTVTCTTCGTAPWDEPLGMTAGYPTIGAARQRLPADWPGWTTAERPDGMDLVLCPECAALAIVGAVAARPGR